MRLVNVNYGPIAPKRAALGQSYETNFNGPREVAFRIVDENGYHVVNPGKKFPFTISNMVWANGTPLQAGVVKGTAQSEAESPSSSIVRVSMQVPKDPNNFALQDMGVDATLSLYGVNGGVTYPIFENRRIRFTMPPASAFPLDLQAIYGEVLKQKEADDAERYAAETAAQDQQMLENYQAGIASEAAAAAATEKARVAAADAAAKKQAASDAAAAAEAARAAALADTAYRNKKIMWAVGGIAALGLLGYFALGE